MTLRALCRSHNISAHSAVVAQAKKGGWAEKRRAYQSRASATFIERHADRAAAREAEVRDHALDAIDEAITRFRSDLRATKEVVLADGTIAEEPVMRITARDMAIVIDRLQVLFGHPAQISEERAFAATITSDAITIDVLRGIIEATRGLAGTPAPEASPLPRLHRRLDD